MCYKGASVEIKKEGQAMDSRERLEKALNHQETDCVPVDLGAGG